jgi:hypothetical protein
VRRRYPFTNTNFPPFHRLRLQSNDRLRTHSEFTYAVRRRSVEDVVFFYIQQGRQLCLLRWTCPVPLSLIKLCALQLPTRPFCISSFFILILPAHIANPKAQAQCSASGRGQTLLASETVTISLRIRSLVDQARYFVTKPSITSSSFNSIDSIPWHTSGPNTIDTAVITCSADSKYFH